MKQELEDAFDLPQASPSRGTAQDPAVLDHRYCTLRNRSVQGLGGGIPL